MNQLKISCRFAHSVSVMRRWEVNRFDLEQTLNNNALLPHLKNPKEVLVKVHASSVNPIDVKMATGYGSTYFKVLRTINSLQAPQFPFVLGRDFSGVVVDIAEGYDRYKKGDEVWGAIPPYCIHGAFSEYVVVSSKWLTRKPNNLSHVQAASMPYVAGTANVALFKVGELPFKNMNGKRVLVVAGAGGIGSFCVQILTTLGAKVVATCSTDAVELVRELGCEAVVDRTNSGSVGMIADLGPYDLVMDPIGSSSTREFATFCKSRGRYVTLTTPLLTDGDDYGAFQGLMRSGQSLLTNAFMDFRKTGSFYRWAFFVPDRRFLTKLTGLVEDKRINPVIHKVWPFEELPLAFNEVEKGTSRGKHVIEIC